MDNTNEPPDPLMSDTPIEWQELSLAVQAAMMNAVKPAVSPLSVSEDRESGSALGTGSYFAFKEAPYLITAEHVVAEANGAMIAHLPVPGDYYVPVTNHFQRCGWPVDVAVTRLSSWPTQLPSRRALNMNCFDTCYKPATRELLFWIGFPGSKAGRHEPLTELRTLRTLFGTLLINGQPILSQSPENLEFHSSNFDPVRHFLVFYPTTAISKAGGAEVELRNPQGISGSLIWDTKWVAATAAGIEWTPDMARVCGLAWGASENPNVLLATKIEYIRPVLLQFFREENAYFRWISNGRKPGTALADWLWAKKTILDF